MNPLRHIAVVAFALSLLGSGVENAHAQGFGRPGGDGHVRRAQRDDDGLPLRIPGRGGWVAQREGYLPPGMPPGGLAEPPPGPPPGWNATRDPHPPSPPPGLMPLDRVVTEIERRMRGRPLDAEIAYMDGRPVYLVYWITPRGQKMELWIDGRTGRLISTR